MRIRGRKITAFFTTKLTLIGLYILTLYEAPELLEGIGRVFIIMIIVNSMSFIGGEVWKSFIISKHYRAELDDRRKK